jgi:hypothetical protein
VGPVLDRDWREAEVTRRDWYALAIFVGIVLLICSIWGGVRI